MNDDDRCQGCGRLEDDSEPLTRCVDCDGLYCPDCGAEHNACDHLDDDEYRLDWEYADDLSPDL